MKHWIIASVTLALACAESANVTETQNKTKRGLSDQIIYGDPSTFKQPAPVYQDQEPSATTPSLIAYYANTQKPYIYSNPVPHLKQVFSEGEPSKQLTAPALVYDYQQSPQNAVSNVHVNQQYQTLPQPEAFRAPEPYRTHEPFRTQVPEERPTVPDTAHTQLVYPQYALPQQIYHQPNLQTPANTYPLFPVRSESVATPVHHRTLIHHGYGNMPPNNQQSNSNPNAGKYLYVNGKIIYHPAVPNVPQNHYQSNLQLQPKPYSQPLNPNYSPYKIPQKLTPPSPTAITHPSVSPLSYNYHNYHKKPYVKTTTLAPKIIHKEEEEEEEPVKSNSKEVEKDEENHESYEKEEEDEEEDFKPYASEKYREDDDDDDHRSYQVEEDDDEDSERESTKYIRAKPKKHYKNESKPYGKYATSDNYKYRESYKTKTKFGKSSDDPKGSGNKEPKTQYKAYRYSKKGNGKPKIEMIEGKHSENVPVIHNSKFFKEKWFVSNSHDE